MPYTQPVKVVMSHKKIQDINEADPLSKAFELMDQCHISALPVKGSSGNYSGVISKSDIVSARFLKLLRAKRLPDNILVREIMNYTAPLYVLETAPIQDAVTMMHKRGIHRLFVADAQYQLTGVISTSEILRLLVLSK